MYKHYQVGDFVKLNIKKECWISSIYFKVHDKYHGEMVKIIKNKGKCNGIMVGRLTDQYSYLVEGCEEYTFFSEDIEDIINKKAKKYR